jgi:hypothetical protein
MTHLQADQAPMLRLIETSSPAPPSPWTVFPAASVPKKQKREIVRGSAKVGLQGPAAGIGFGRGAMRRRWRGRQGARVGPGQTGIRPAHLECRGAAYAFPRPPADKETP